MTHTFHIVAETTGLYRLIKDSQAISSAPFIKNVEVTKQILLGGKPPIQKDWEPTIGHPYPVDLSGYVVSKPFEEKDQANCKACKIDCLKNLKGVECKAPIRSVVTITKEEIREASENLLPCPFCGTSSEWINEALADSHYYIRCMNGECHAMVKADRRDKAIGFWNRRFLPVAAPLEYVLERPVEGGIIGTQMASLESGFRSRKGEREAISFCKVLCS